MKKEIDNIEEEDFNIEELLSEDEDNPIDELEEEVPVKAKKKSKAAPKDNTVAQVEPEVPAEVTMANKELQDMEWQPFSQVAYEGLQNIKTGELIDNKEAIRRCLCYAQEAARNSR